MILRELELKDQSAFMDLLDNWEGSSGFNMLYGMIAGLDFAAYLKVLSESKEGINLAESDVASTSLFAFLGDVIIGKVSVRHSLNAYLQDQGGHIGYGILPAYRGKGYATQILKESLVYCQGLGLERVLITCDETNLASIRVIEKNGGIFENAFCPSNASRKILRYWITFQSS